MLRATREPLPAVLGPATGGAPGGRFRLLRYFTVTALVAFAVVGLALYVLQTMEENFFDQVQLDQAEFLQKAQAELSGQHEAAARGSLLAVHEAGHVNLTRLLANTLWETDFGPFVDAAQRIPIHHCRQIVVPPQAASAPAASNPRRACFAEVGRQIRALPSFRAIDVQAYAAMRASTVFKIKVFDLRGVTVYSSEHLQVGEDGSGNQGWAAAAGGRAASELTHRDRFSAFEQVVENRDLISSYLPVRMAGSDEVVGVFEIYSDATPFLDQIKSASRKFSQITAGNQARVAQSAQANQDKVYSNSDRFLWIVGSLQALLFGALWLIVRGGQRIIDRQTLAQEQSALREQLWHREKMAALAAMAANVSHEVGNPLAIISGVAEDLSYRESEGQSLAQPSRLILDQTNRIAAMMRQIADFATARNVGPEWVDVNSMVKAVCDFLAFDRRFVHTPIAFTPAPQLPACQVVPDHLNEVLMGLLQACVEDLPHGARCERIAVETTRRHETVTIRITCSVHAADSPVAIAGVFDRARAESVRRRVQEMGGLLRTSADAVEIELPPSREQAGPPLSQDAQPAGPR